MTLQSDFRTLIYALSDALDLVGADDPGHGKRVGILAAECGRKQGMPAADIAFLFDLGLLHDIGVSSSQVHRTNIQVFDWSGAQTHCETGRLLLDAFPPLRPLALPTRYHHTPWHELRDLGLPSALALQANLIFLVDRVDALAVSRKAQGPAWMLAADLRAEIARHRGTTFDPELVDLFLDASASEAFWLLLEPRSVQGYLQDMQRNGPTYGATLEDLRQLALIFARIVDAKSPFTAEHSLGVAEVARKLAEKLGLDGDRCLLVEIAGLLHDIGKLRVPDEILDKPGSLDVRERQIINTHSFETFQILRHLEGFEEIAPWTAYHHEEPEGRGYPFHLDARTLPLEARLLRIADIFQAMAQTRPYRKGLRFDMVMAFLRELAAQGRLEPALVELVGDCGEELMTAAQAGVQVSAS